MSNEDEPTLYRLAEELKSPLKKPWGRLIPNREVSRAALLKEVEGSKMIVAVGDATTETLHNLGLPPDIYVVDGREKRATRSPPTPEAESELRVKNPPGHISEEAIQCTLRASEETRENTC